VAKKKRVLSEVETHPYGAFMPIDATSIIVGSFPIAKFTQKTRPQNLTDGEVDFSYGGNRSQLWNLLSICYSRELKTKDQICQFLRDEKIAIGDVIISCQRIGGSSSDNDLRNCIYFTGLKGLIENSPVKTIYFTSTKVRDIFHKKVGSIDGVKELLLISPSGSGIRRLNKIFEAQFLHWKKANASSKITEFRVYMYQEIFNKN
jgi:hypothetical protein